MDQVRMIIDQVVGADSDAEDGSDASARVQRFTRRKRLSRFFGSVIRREVHAAAAAAGFDVLQMRQGRGRAEDLYSSEKALGPPAAT